MGIPVINFVNVSEDFICPICTDVVEHAVSILICSHMFCNDCLTGWFETLETQTCPMCRQNVNGEIVHKTYVDNQIGNLTAKCPNGCGHQYRYDDLVLQLPQCNPPLCPNGCGFKGFDLAIHNCIIYLRKNLDDATSLSEELRRDLTDEREYSLQIQEMHRYQLDQLNLDLERTNQENQALETMVTLLRNELRESIRSHLGRTHSMVLRPRRN